MNVNKFKITPPTGDTQFTIPFGTGWDLLDREDAIKTQEALIVEEVIGKPTNYELARFAHGPFLDNTTRLLYRFYFAPARNEFSQNTYLTKFNADQVNFYSYAFAKSFFKLDFYDTTDPKQQKIYLTMILETRQSLSPLQLSNGEVDCRNMLISFFRSGLLRYTNCCGGQEELTVTVNSIFGVAIPSLQTICFRSGEIITYTYINSEGLEIEGLVEPVTNEPGVFISLVASTTCDCTGELVVDPEESLKTPTFSLDYTGDKEGFFIYWYEDLSVLNIDTLYMTAKFFNGNTGQYTKFIINDQSTYLNQNLIPNNDFYYRVNFNYINKTYTISYTPSPLARINNIEWYEYLNPND
jgi:hypothetical protein